MRPLRTFAALTLGFFLVTGMLNEALAAASCGEPVPAPMWQIGDTWTFQDELGDERTETVLGYEGELTIVERGRTRQRSILFYDADLVLRKVVQPDGTVLDKPDHGFLFGLKTLDFPLHVGKTWSFTVADSSDQGRPHSRIYRVMGCEEVTVPAGKLSALKIEITRKPVAGRKVKWIHHEWYAPAAKKTIRGVYRRGDQEGKRYEWELLRYQVK